MVQNEHVHIDVLYYTLVAGDALTEHCGSTSERKLWFHQRDEAKRQGAQHEKTASDQLLLAAAHVPRKYRPTFQEALFAGLATILTGPLLHCHEQTSVRPHKQPGGRRAGALRSRVRAVRNPLPTKLEHIVDFPGTRLSEPCTRL